MLFIGRQLIIPSSNINWTYGSFLDLETMETVFYSNFCYKKKTLKRLNKEINAAKVSKQNIPTSK